MSSSKAYRYNSFPNTSTKIPDHSIKNPRPNKTEQLTLQHGVAVAPAVSHSLNPWKLLGSDLPMGSPKFQRIVEHFFATRNGNPLSDAMERAIQLANKRGVKVPPPFFDAKRVIERREAQEVSAPSEVIPELEAEPWAR
jgi:hypothetical protein